MSLLTIKDHGTDDVSFRLCPMLNGTMKPEDAHTGFGGGGGPNAGGFGGGSSAFGTPAAAATNTTGAMDFAEGLNGGGDD